MFGSGSELYTKLLYESYVAIILLAGFQAAVLVVFVRRTKDNHRRFPSGACASGYRYIVRVWWVKCNPSAYVYPCYSWQSLWQYFAANASCSATVFEKCVVPSSPVTKKSQSVCAGLATASSELLLTLLMGVGGKPV